jgi:O-methyltransferase
MSEDTSRELYIELLKRVLTRYGFSDDDWRELHLTRPPFSVLQPVLAMLRKRGLVIGRAHKYDKRHRACGLDWPVHAETMVGLRRLDNLHECIRTIIRDNVPGDLVETGVWRGGASIFMKGVLTAYGETRDMWLADSFEGLPAPDEANFPSDKGWRFDKASWYLAVSEDEVRENFKRYELLDEHVKFVKGWFRDTLGSLPATRIALLRLDGDLYESTIQALEPLYPRLSAGGYCVIDDYGAVKGCEEAVHDYRAKHNITEPIVDIDGSGVFWRKSAGETAITRTRDEENVDWLVDWL